MILQLISIFFDVAGGGANVLAVLSEARDDPCSVCDVLATCQWVCEDADIDRVCLGWLMVRRKKRYNQNHGGNGKYAVEVILQKLLHGLLPLALCGFHAQIDHGTFLSMARGLLGENFR